MKLSKNFHLSEFTKSHTAQKLDIDNKPNANVRDNIERLVLCLLQPLRTMTGKAITVNSGYRCPELNKVIGGSKTSQHMTGEAADIEIDGMDNKALFKLICDNFVFDQVILEDYIHGQPSSGWVHVSIKKHNNRGHILHKHRGAGYLLVGTSKNRFE